MAQDDYIKHIMKNVRMDEPSVKNHKDDLKKQQKNGSVRKSSPIRDLLEEAKKYEVVGAKRRMIKMDRKHEDILKVLYPLFGVEVYRFINLLLEKFIEDNPELVQAIKEKIKKL